MFASRFSPQAINHVGDIANFLIYFGCISLVWTVVFQSNDPIIYAVVGAATFAYMGFEKCMHRRPA